MNHSLRSSALAARLLTGVAIFAVPAAWAQQAPKPADTPVLEPGHSTVATVAETPDSGTMKRADKDMLAVLKKLAELGAKPIESRSVAEARAQPTPADAVKAVLKDRGKDPVALMAAMKVSKKDVTYPTAGGTQAIRLYTPEGAGAGPLPVIVYYHGGGWVIADIETYEASAMALAKKSNAIAPENKVPAAHQDSFAAYQWVLANAGQFGGDPARVAVAGESAGGNLAVNVAIMARDQMVQAPVHMLIVYPVAGTNMTTPSYIANQNAMRRQGAGFPGRRQEPDAQPDHGGGAEGPASGDSDHGLDRSVDVGRRDAGGEAQGSGRGNDLQELRRRHA